MKLFIVAAASILTSLFTIAHFGLMPSLNFVLSSAIITISVVLYNNIGKEHSASASAAEGAAATARAAVGGANALLGTLGALPRARCDGAVSPRSQLTAAQQLLDSRDDSAQSKASRATGRSRRYRFAVALVVVVSIGAPALYVFNRSAARPQGGGGRSGGAEGALRGDAAGSSGEAATWRSSAVQFSDGLTALFTEHGGRADESALALADGHDVMLHTSQHMCLDILGHEIIEEGSNVCVS